MKPQLLRTLRLCFGVTHLSGQSGQVVDVPAGYVVEDLNGNPLIHSNGGPVTTVTLDSRGLENFEIKTGNACLTSGQSCVYTMQVSGGDVTAVGGNANALGLNGSAAPTSVYVLRPQ